MEQAEFTVLGPYPTRALPAEYGLPRAGVWFLLFRHAAPSGSVRGL